MVGEINAGRALQATARSLVDQQCDPIAAETYMSPDIWWLMADLIRALWELCLNEELQVHIQHVFRQAWCFTNDRLTCHLWHYWSLLCHDMIP